MTRKPFAVGDQVVAKTPLGRTPFTSPVLDVHVNERGDAAYLVAWGSDHTARVWTSSVKAA